VKPFSQHFYENYLLEYRHKTADGFDKPSVKAHNGKDPNRLNKKYIHTVGPYKPKEKDLHKLGKVLMGDRLLAILAEYNIDFEDGRIAAVKNSPFSLQMYMTPQGQPAAKIIKKQEL
jgi:hypothetical protein